MLSDFISKYPLNMLDYQPFVDIYVCCGWWAHISLPFEQERAHHNLNGEIHGGEIHEHSGIPKLGTCDTSHCFLRLNIGISPTAKSIEEKTCSLLSSWEG